MESQSGETTILELQRGSPLMGFETSGRIHVSKRRKNREVIKQRAARDPLSFIVVQWRARLEEPQFQSYRGVPHLCHLKKVGEFTLGKGERPEK